MGGATLPVIDPNEKITRTSLSNFIDLATSFIVRISHTKQQDPQNIGKFTYISNLGGLLQTNFREQPQTDYNLLRHNGAIYALALSYKRKKDPNVLQAIIRSVDFLKERAIMKVPDPHSVADNDADDFAQFQTFLPNLLAPFETKAVTPTQETPVAKVGGAGLALIALVSLEQIEPGHTDLAYMRQIAEFIGYLQNEDGSFVSRFFPTDGGKDESWTSLYYPGEAALGLIYLASIETDKNLRNGWIARATMALLYLESYRRKQDLLDIEPDHWALLATAKLLPLLDERSREYWLVYDHAVQVAKSMLSAYTKQELLENNGCFTLDSRTCPTATRMEGLLAALTFIRKEERFIGNGEKFVENLRERMETDIELSIKFLLESQEVDDSFKMDGGVPVRFPIESVEDKEVRVDYVQHAMSAIIAYEEFLKSKRPSIQKLKKMLPADVVGPTGTDYSTGAYLLVILVAFGVAASVAPFGFRRHGSRRKGE